MRGACNGRTLWRVTAGGGGLGFAIKFVSPIPVACLRASTDATDKGPGKRRGEADCFSLEFKVYLSTLFATESCGF